MKLYTVGYTSFKDVEHLVRTVETLNAIIIDVRYYPYSKGWLEQYSKDNLEKKIPNNYIHLGFLIGNMNFKDGGDFKYPNLDMGIKVLKNYCKYSNVILMCCEKKPWECHRRDLANMIKPRNEIIHLIRSK